jgi:hypothetical protein
LFSPLQLSAKAEAGASCLGAPCMLYFFVFTLKEAIFIGACNKAKNAFFHTDIWISEYQIKPKLSIENHETFWAIWAI